MLVKLIPEQVSRAWPDIKFAIEQSLPPVVGMQSDRMSNILRGILTEDVVVWSLVNTKDDNKIAAIGLTTFTFDGASGTKSMLIYCIYGYGVPVPGLWKDGFKTLEKYAKSKGCHRITAYSSEKSIIKYAKALGAEAKYTFISFPLEN